MVSSAVYDRKKRSVLKFFLRCTCDVLHL